MTWMQSLKDHLAANSLGTYGLDLFIGTMADTDANRDIPVLALARYKGNSIEVGGGGKVDIPMLQVAVRAKDYDEAEERIEESRDLLRQITNQAIQGTHFLRVQPDGTIKDLQRDDRGRQRFTADFEVYL